MQEGRRRKYNTAVKISPFLLLISLPSSYVYFPYFIAYSLLLTFNEIKHMSYTYDNEEREWLHIVCI